MPGVTIGRRFEFGLLPCGAEIDGNVYLADIEIARPRMTSHRKHVAAGMLDLHPDAVETVVVFLRPAVVVDLAEGASLFG